MAIVPLEFLPPDEPNIVNLHIWESDQADGAYNRIETVTEVGAYPNYITHYTTTQAISENDWFAIQWEDSKGALSNLSAPLQGGSRTLVGEIVDRVVLRDSTFDENIAAQEAEAVIEFVFGADPYSIDPATVTYTQLQGITDVVLAEVGIQKITSTTAATASSAVSYTAGIVSERSDTSALSKQGTLSYESYEKLYKRGLKKLGLGGSRVGQMSDINRSFIELGEGLDSSRLLATVITRAIELADVE